MYEKQTWEEFEAEYPNRYSKSNEDETKVDLVRSPGVVSAGTPVSAARLNHMEDGIERAHGKTVVGTATFAKATNKITMSELDNLDLEIGDVIQISGATNAANNKIFTVEMVAPGEVVVNYEHRNGAGSLSLEDEEAENVTIRLLSKWYNAPLGLGQDWVNVIGNRSADTQYTSPENRTIAVSAMGVRTGAKLEIYLRGNGSILTISATAPPSNGESVQATAMVVIPGNTKYNITLPYGGNIASWRELR